ncbi:helicase-related protein [Aquibaculum sediminis]|uniref:helicase-related protein n=1 Tax=Aquibaculum sediminis TaxID=3231907 RepID=UPI0034549BCF
MQASSRDRVVAVLGPTNTGKTHFAIERMLGHSSGIIGFPLRLLARENYDRVVKLKGARQVALITGEEKIVPPSARYFLCTVESMPLDRPASFLAVDEIQLAADPERGHVFTDRLLHARGHQETLFLGADTIRPLLTKLVPGVEIITRPRFSKLSYAGTRKVTRLPPRSAVVAFSAAEVYAMAELVRRQRGGTAVVLGALSPRTRNAQVAMFESGEVDYLVATDAIGMGLNLGLDHVAFARLSKFDGHSMRRLSAPEVAQIAGRAGRHMSDGTFGTTAELGPMSEELIEAVEDHRFQPLTALYWRASRLEFRSPQELLRSLEARSPDPALIRVRPPEDQQALAALAQDADIAAMAANPGSVRLLWDVCQVPDFQKSLTDQHLRLLKQIFRHLRGSAERLPEDWVAQQIGRIDRVDGDIDALVARIAQIRTWTFITHRGDWLEDAGGWRDHTRAIEDRLSDALHERLTQRFVDRRTATLVRRLKTGEALLAAVRRNGEVVVEGEDVGRLEGFHFRLDRTIREEDARPVLAATRRALQSEIPHRIALLEADDDGAFRLDSTGRLLWREAPIGQLVAGETPLTPKIRVEDSEFLDGAARERVRLRTEAWLTRFLRNRIGSLYALEEAPLQGAARGLAFQLAESLGSLPRASVTAQLDLLTKAERRMLAELKVRIGAESLYLADQLKLEAIRLRALLWSVHKGAPLPSLPAADEPPVLEGDAASDESLCRALGFRRLRGRGKAQALRVDRLERLGQAAHRRLAQAERHAGFPVDDQLLKVVEGDSDLLRAALATLGFRSEQKNEELRFHRQRRRVPSQATGPAEQKRGGPRRKKPSASENRQVASDSPFAVLQTLKRARS